MAVNLSPIGNDAPFIDASGNPLSGGLLYTYTAGSSTPTNTYTTSSGGVANANPVVLDSNGYPSSGGNVVEIWLTATTSYKFILKTSAGVTVWTRDNISGINDVTGTASEWTTGPAPTYISATSFSLVGDQTSTFQIGRRLRTTNSGGTLYSRISNSVFGAVTTVTVVNDSTALDSGLSAVSYGLLSATNPSVPNIFDATAPLVETMTAGRPTYSISNISPRLLENIGLTVTMGASAATIALKGANGSDPSATTTVGVSFRNATLATGTASKVLVTAAMSTVISSGSTGGTTSAVASRIWIAAINNSGTVELAWMNSGNVVSGLSIDEGALISTTAEGGAGAADSAGVWYSTTARASVPFVVLGYFDSTQATAGTWATAVTSIVLNPHTVPATQISLGNEVASTSGTSIDFTGIPSGTRRITINFKGVSTSGTDNLLIQLGDAGGIENSGYLGAGSGMAAVVASSNYTTGFGIRIAAATAVLHGSMVLNLEDASDFSWEAMGMFGSSAAAEMYVTAGSKSTSQELDRVRITTVSGTDTFDAGVINISYER